MPTSSTLPAVLESVGPGTDLTSVASILVKSKYFADVREAAQAMVKIKLGQELGFSPVQSMMGVHVIQGKPALSAHLMAALIQRSGKYRYRVRKLDNTGCELEFFECVDPRPPFAWEKVGDSAFSHADAVVAGIAFKPNFKAFPRNMLFSRALSNGFRWYCAGLSGTPVYTPDELGGTETFASNGVVTAEVIPAQPTAFDAPDTEIESVIAKLDALGDWRKRPAITHAIFGEPIRETAHLALLRKQEPKKWREGLERLGLDEAEA